MSGTKSDPQDEILPVAKLRQILALVDQKPLGCAFGLTKDKKECLLLVDKRAKPKKVATLLKKEAKEFLDVGTLRFGRVEIDAKNDPGTLKFTVNRSEAGGTLTTLVRLAKKAGHQAIVINTNGDLENEEEEGEEVDGEEGQGAPVLQQVTPVDPAALKARLTDLVKKMIARIAVDPTQKDEMAALAKHANIMLGTNNWNAGTADMDALQAILDVPVVTPTGSSSDQPKTDAGAPAVSTVAVGKSRQIWGAVRKQVSSDIDKVRAEIVKTYQADGISGELETAYKKFTTGIVTTFNDDLENKLLEVLDEQDPAKRTKMLQEANTLLGTYKSFVSSDSAVTELESNPFTPVTIRKTVSDTIAMLSKTLGAPA